MSDLVQWLQSLPNQKSARHSIPKNTYIKTNNIEMWCTYRPIKLQHELQEALALEPKKVILKFDKSSDFHLKNFISKYRSCSQYSKYSLLHDPMLLLKLVKPHRRTI